MRLAVGLSCMRRSGIVLIVSVETCLGHGPGYAFERLLLDYQRAPSWVESPLLARKFEVKRVLVSSALACPLVLWQLMVPQRRTDGPACKFERAPCRSLATRLISK